MVELKGLLWKKLRKGEKGEEEPKTEAKKEEVKRQEKPKEEVKPEVKPKSEEELRKMSEILRGEDEEIRKQEEMLKQKKIEIFKSYELLNIDKLRSMGYDMKQNAIRCVICRKWMSYDKEKLSELIKKNDVDIIWKYVCKECRKKTKKIRGKISEKYVPQTFIGSE